jgi:microcystin-dependent protein
MSQPFVGEIRAFGFNFAPRGWQLCNGQTLSIQQNAALFSLLGTTYGGNGTSTFQLPNLQGRLAIHQGTGAGLPAMVIGEFGGVQNVSLNINNLPAHTHLATVTGGGAPTVTVNGSPSAGTTNVPNGNYIGVPTGLARGAGTYVLPANAGTVGPIAGVTATGGGVAGVTNALTGSNIPVNVQNPYLVISYCIAIVGIFPSRN